MERDARAQTFLIDVSDARGGPRPRPEHRHHLHQRVRDIAPFLTDLDQYMFGHNFGIAFTAAVVKATRER